MTSAVKIVSNPVIINLQITCTWQIKHNIC